MKQVEGRESCLAAPEAYWYPCQESGEDIGGDAVGGSEVLYDVGASCPPYLRSRQHGRIAVQVARSCRALGGRLFLSLCVITCLRFSR